MKITEAKLRKMIRSVIREFVSSATAGGASVDTGASADTKAKQADYNAKKSTKTGISAVEPKTANGISKRYQRPSRKGGYDYTDTAKSGFTSNRDYTTWETNKATADADEAAALAVLNQAKEADLQRTTPEKPPTTAAKKVTKKKKKD